VRAYGATKPVAGDLVCEEPGGADAAAGAGRRTDSGGGVMDMRVRRLTAEEAAAGRYSVRDVVLPMPAQAVEVRPRDPTAAAQQRLIRPRPSRCARETLSSSAASLTAAATSSRAAAPRLDSAQAVEVGRRGDCMTGGVSWPVHIRVGCQHGGAA
jgi:hypothetical protein